MKNFTFREIWLQIDVNGDGEAVTLNGNPPLIYPGFEYMFRIGMYDRLPSGGDDVGEFRNIASIVAFILRVRSGSYAGTLLLDTSDPTAIAAGARVDPNATATEQDFLNKAKAPMNVYLPKEVTESITAAQHYMTFTGASIENAAQPDAFGRARLQVIDLGQGVVGAAPAAAAADYVRSDIFRAAMNGKVSFGTNPRGLYPVIVNEDGSYGTALKTGGNGEFAAEQIQNP